MSCSPSCPPSPPTPPRRHPILRSNNSGFWMLSLTNRCAYTPLIVLNISRVTPSAGMTVAGHRIPGDTVVTVSKHVVHQNKFIYGEDVDVYRPERWLEASEEQVNVMRRTLVSFSKGKYSCLGKNLARMMVYKITAGLFGTFGFDLVTPGKGERFRSRDGIFAVPEDIMVRVRRR